MFLHWRFCSSSSQSLNSSSVRPPLRARARRFSVSRSLAVMSDTSSSSSGWVEVETVWVSVSVVSSVFSVEPDWLTPSWFCVCSVWAVVPMLLSRFF